MVLHSVPFPPNNPKWFYYNYTIELFRVSNKSIVKRTTKFTLINTLAKEFTYGSNEINFGSNFSNKIWEYEILISL